MNDKAIYRYYADCGRNGDLDAIFVASKKQVAATIGKTIYFGEVLGKHSEIYGPLEEHDVTMVTDDPVAVKMFEDYKLSTGRNPLEYVQEENQ